MVPSSSFSDLSRASSSSSSSAVTKPSKTKKSVGFLTLSSKSSRSAATSGGSKADNTEPDVKTKRHLPTFKTKSSTLPRPPKPTKTVTTATVGGATGGASPPKKIFSLSRSSSSNSKNESSLKSNTKTSNLSFSELKKQHQLLLKEVESLKNKLSENEEQHKKSLQESLGKLEDSELTYRLLQEELARKENDIKDRDETIKELKSQLDSVSFDKERLLMVLENAHRDAITGEPIFADTNTWQQMRDEANEKIQYYSSMLDDLIGSLQLTNVQLEEQEKDLTTTAASSDQMFL